MFKDKPIAKAIVWTIVLLLFPIVSGTISTIAGFDVIHIYITQGCFMYASLLIPLVYILVKGISFTELGLCKTINPIGKKVLYFIPALAVEIPLLIVGVDLNSFQYIAALTLFTLAVGMSEEVYFRGIIIRLLKGKYSIKRSVIISAMIFGIGHIASILAGNSLIAVLLQILNAIVFGVIAAEIVIITGSILPTILWHFIFDFVNHITIADGITEIVVIVIQEFIMVGYACYLWKQLPLKDNNHKKISTLL